MSQTRQWVSAVSFGLLTGAALGACFHIPTRLAVANPQLVTNRAIVQLKDLQLPPPKVQGQATLPLQFLPDSQAFTLKLTAKNLSKNVSGQFLLDTGASTSIIAPSLATHLQLVGQPIPTERLSLAVAGDNCPPPQGSLYRLPTLLTTGLPRPVSIQGLHALVFPRKQLPPGILGVLGMDVLSQFDLKLNPPAKQLQLLPPSQLRSIPGLVTVPLQKQLGVMIAEVKVNGQGPFKFMIDTAADSVFVSPSLAQRLNLPLDLRKPLEVLGFCGLEKAEILPLGQVDLQGLQQNNLEGIILYSPVLNLLQVDGILGQSFLNRYQQHWRFTPAQIGMVQAAGSLQLTPNSPTSPAK